MTFGGLRARQILALGLLATVIVVISLSWEVSEFTRMTLEKSRHDADYISQSLVAQIGHVVASAPDDPYDALVKDAHLKVTLRSATQNAPTVFFTAFSDSAGQALLHTDPQKVGSLMQKRSALPSISGLIAPWRFILELSGEGKIYEHVTPLRMGDSAFGAVHVAQSSTFIKTEILTTVRRGMLVGLGQLALALVAAFFLTRIFVHPLREVRRGIEALRAGDFSYRIPHQEINEFADMANAINELGAKFRKRQEEGGEHTLKRAMEHLGDGLLLVGAEREISHINGIASRQLGLDQEEILGKSFSEVFGRNHPLDPLLKEILSGKSQRMSLRAEIAGNNGHSGMMAVGHSLEEDGKLSGVLIELKDLSLLSELQAVMDHSNTLTRLGEMAAGVAHEIRNPLNAITLHLEPLSHAETLDPEHVQEAVVSTREQIARLDRAVSGFLKVARLQRLTMAPVSVPQLTAELVDLVAPEATMAGLELVVECEEGLKPINGDVEVLRQSLLNLIKNSIQALPSRDQRVVIRCKREEGRIGIEVSDTGPGIDPEMLPKIFDLYMTTKESGTGVGLAFVRQAVEMHRGTVSVESQPDQGTTITLWLRAEIPLETSHAS